MIARAFPVVIGLGSNLRDRVAGLRRARTELFERGVMTVLGESPIIETEPIGPPCALSRRGCGFRA